MPHGVAVQDVPTLQWSDAAMARLLDAVEQESIGNRRLIQFDIEMEELAAHAAWLRGCITRLETGL